MLRIETLDAIERLTVDVVGWVAGVIERRRPACWRLASSARKVFGPAMPSASRP